MGKNSVSLVKTHEVVGKNGNPRILVLYRAGPGPYANCYGFYIVCAVGAVILESGESWGYDSAEAAILVANDVIHGGRPMLNWVKS